MLEMIWPLPWEVSVPEAKENNQQSQQNLAAMTHRCQCKCGRVDGPSLSTIIVGAWPAKAILMRLFQGKTAEESEVCEPTDKGQQKDEIVALNVPAGRGFDIAARPKFPRASLGSKLSSAGGGDQSCRAPQPYLLRFPLKSTFLTFRKSYSELIQDLLFLAYKLYCLIFLFHGCIWLTLHHLWSLRPPHP